jgi:hypothetical protein
MYVQHAINGKACDKWKSSGLSPKILPIVSRISRTGVRSPTDTFSVRSGPTVDLKNIFFFGPAVVPLAGVLEAAGVLDLISVSGSKSKSKSSKSDIVFSHRFCRFSHLLFEKLM